MKILRYLQTLVIKQNKQNKTKVNIQYNAGVRLGLIN